MRPVRSATSSTSPSAIIAAEINHRLRAPFSIRSRKAYPIAPIGTVATITYQPIRYSALPRTERSPIPRTQAAVICRISRQK